MAEQLALPDVIARNLLPVIHKINYLLLIGLPAVFVVVLGWSVFLSYRFVAPLERGAGRRSAPTLPHAAHR